MKRIVAVLLLISCCFSSLLLGTTKGPQPPVRDNGNWFGAMEASLLTTRAPNAQPAVPVVPERDGVWLAWMGWMVAAAFMIILGALHMRIRRQHRNMIRGGEPDFFFLPPARDRRRNPR